jgi:hypothetical protein
MIKALNKLGKEGMYLNIKAVFDKPIQHHTGKKLKPFPQRQE